LVKHFRLLSSQSEAFKEEKETRILFGSMIQLVKGSWPLTECPDDPAWNHVNGRTSAVFDCSHKGTGHFD